MLQTAHDDPPFKAYGGNYRQGKRKSCCIALKMNFKLAYPIFPFESEAKGGNLIVCIKQRQLKIEWVLKMLISALS